MSQPRSDTPPLPVEVADLLEALTDYEQCDHDGVIVKVSRQACEEAAELIRSRYTQRSETITTSTDDKPLHEQLKETVGYKAASATDASEQKVIEAAIEFAFKKVIGSRSRLTWACGELLKVRALADRGAK